MAGRKEGHHLIDQIFVSKAVRLESDGKDIDAAALLGPHAFFFQGD